MTKRLIAILCLSGLVAAQAAPAFSQSAAAPKDVPATSDATGGRSTACSARWIAAAAEKQIAPNLVGCNIKDVTAPLLRAKIVPAPRETDNTASVGTILTQRPAAGEPLKPFGRLTLQVSTGKAPAPAQETPAPATSAAPEQPPERPPVSSAAPTEPAAASSSAASPAPEPAASAESKPPLLTDGRVEFKEVPVSAKPTDVPDSLREFITTYPLVLLVGLGIFFAAIAGLAMNGRKTGRTSSKVLPRVACEATFGPGRLVRRGPLVLGEKGDK
jgi:hypothetical protein